MAPSLNIQQGMAVNFQQPIYSPQSFHSPFPMPNHPPPIQQFFAPHQVQPSIAQLAAAGIHPPAAFPVPSHLPRPSMMNLGHPQPSAPPFPQRNRRQLSIGGPPKAVLGGPARKLSPLPVIPATNPPPTPPKVKKLIVNLPKEIILGDNGHSATRPSWGRTPLVAPEFRHQDIPQVETTTAEIYPPNRWAKHMPNTIDVFLPGKVCFTASCAS